MRTIRSTLIFAVLTVILLCPVHADSVGGAEGKQDIYLGRFSSGGTQGWREKVYKGKTAYQISELDGEKVLQAASANSASGLYYEQKIDLEKTPVLNWRWRVAKPLANNREREKAGDDFAARVYVVISGGLTFWNTQAINYVWASGMAKNTSWPNPFAGDHAIMLALRSAGDKTGVWHQEKRNIREDFKRLTGKDERYIDAVALMTDTDNGGGEAKAYYGDIYFSAD